MPHRSRFENVLHAICPYDRMCIPLKESELVAGWLHPRMPFANMHRHTSLLKEDSTTHFCNEEIVDTTKNVGAMW